MMTTAQNVIKNYKIILIIMSKLLDSESVWEMQASISTNEPSVIYISVIVFEQRTGGMP